MSTTFNADLPLGKVTKHPRNPRHKATADVELVDSVKASGLVQPIVVAPVNGQDKYVLIAGHRRLDACRKAGLKTAPAIVRTDLDTDGRQIEAMLIENGRRADLTPIEEAEGYAQLELLGYKQVAIATAVGRDVKTVRARLKLLKLSASTKKKVHAGQLTIDDATAMGAYTDDPDATARLEKAAAEGRLKERLATERKRAKALESAAAKAAELVAAGARELTDITPTISGWQLDIPPGMTKLYSGDAAEEHTSNGCLGFVITTGDPSSGWYHPEVVLICTDTAHHAEADELADIEARKAEADRREQVRAEAEARQLAEDASREARISTVMDIAAQVTTLPPAMVDLLRTFLPALVKRTDTGDIYQQCVIDEDDRWEGYRFNYSLDDMNRRLAATRFHQHVDDLATGSATYLAKCLAAVLVAAAEDVADDAGIPHRLDTRLLGDYLAFLREAGHVFTDIDNELDDDANVTPDISEPDQEVAS